MLPSPKDITISTFLCYGIFVTFRSYGIGIRKPIRCQHYKMLVGKVARNEVPGEIIEMIVDALLSYDEQFIQDIWDKHSAYDSRIDESFFIPGPRTHAEDGVCKLVVSSSLPDSGITY